MYVYEDEAKPFIRLFITHLHSNLKSLVTVPAPVQRCVPLLVVLIALLGVLLLLADIIMVIKTARIPRRNERIIPHIRRTTAPVLKKKHLDRCCLQNSSLFFKKKIVQ